MKISELIVFFAFGAIAIYIVASMFRDWSRKRQITRMLASRNQNDDDAFRKLFLRPGLADIAVRVRRILAGNLKLSLQGLTPNDRLGDDLNAELAANPHLFWELEKEFEIKTLVEDVETYEKTLSRLITFQDLVEYVESRVAARGTESPEEEEEKPSTIYAFAIRSIPYLCFGGMAIAVVGIFVQNGPPANFGRLAKIGMLLFMSGFAVWSLANGGEMLRGTLKFLRGKSRSEIAARPWPLILVVVALVFLWFGGGMMWLLVKSIWFAK